MKRKKKKYQVSPKLDIVIKVIKILNIK